MPPALKPAVPSRRLLRFLRAQSEGLWFADCASRLANRRHVCACARIRPAETLSLSVPTARRKPTLQAAFLGLDAIFPKALTKQRTSASQEPGQHGGVGGAQRYASSNQTPGEDGGKSVWQEWLFGSDAKKQGDALKDGDIRVRLEEESGSIFQRRSLTAKAALDPRLRCTEVDGNGKVIMVDGELKKSELIAKVRNTNSTRFSVAVLLTVSLKTVRPSPARSPQD